MQNCQEYSSISMIFDEPFEVDLTGEREKRVHSDLQRIVNLICVENASESVLNSLLLPENIEETYHGPLMAIQFWERFKEYFSVGGLPKAPLIKSEILGFCMDSRNLWIQNDEQLDWILEYLESHDLPTKDLEQKYTTKKGKKSPFPKFNSELDCNSCGRIMSTLPTDLHDLHRQGHKAWIDAGEKIVETGQRLTPSYYTNDVINFKSSLERYITAYNAIGTWAFHKGQKLATFSMWLAPACQRILDFLKRTPKLTSGSEYIGYQFQTFLELHLNTDLHLRIPDIIGMKKQARSQYCLKHFRFLTDELENKMQRGFQTPMKLNDNGWMTHEWTGEICNICNVVKFDPKGIDTVRHNHVLGSDVIECPMCGYDYKTKDDSKAMKQIHNQLHRKFAVWDEDTVNISTGVNFIRSFQCKWIKDAE